jgi:hypothetical protein
MTKMLTREIRKMSGHFSRHFLVGRFSHGTSLDATSFVATSLDATSFVATSLVATSVVAISAKRRLPFGVKPDQPAASLSRETRMWTV